MWKNTEIKAESVDLYINTTVKITLDFAGSDDHIHMCKEIPIFLCDGSEVKLLSIDFLKENIESLVFLLEKALLKKLFLHFSIVNRDIGYFYNNYLQGKSGLYYTTLEGRSYWVGMYNLLWTNYVATWLYNTANGTIAIEVTPVYPGNFIGEDNNVCIESYEHWLHNYHIYKRYEISLDVAHIWLQKAKQLLISIDRSI